MDGVAEAAFLPDSSIIARTRPQVEPTSTVSPRDSVPDCTSTVATGPRPLSSRASITRPRAGAFSGARISACSSTFSSRSSMPWPVLADTPTKGTSPPYSSGTTLCATSSWRTRSGLASGLSILVMATTSGTSAARACEIASIVCGITPSSAATTRITMSVALAPRARIAVKAA